MEFEQLLQRAKEGDEWAFEQIFKMYRPLLLKQAIGPGLCISAFKNFPYNGQ